MAWVSQEDGTMAMTERAVTEMEMGNVLGPPRYVGGQDRCDWQCMIIRDLSTSNKLMAR